MRTPLHGTSPTTDKISSEDMGTSPSSAAKKTALYKLGFYGLGVTWLFSEHSKCNIWPETTFLPECT